MPADYPLNSQPPWFDGGENGDKPSSDRIMIFLSNSLCCLILSGLPGHLDTTESSVYA
jgi:hypothetical protein